MSTAGPPEARGSDLSPQGEGNLMSGETESSVVARKGTLWGTVKAVGWSFVGMRRGSDFEQDGARLNPLHIIVVGFAGVFVFVVALIALVNWVVAK